MQITSEKITKYGVYILVFKGVKSDFATDITTLTDIDWSISFAICFCKVSLQFINCKIKRLRYNINHYA